MDDLDFLMKFWSYAWLPGLWKGKTVSKKKQKTKLFKILLKFTSFYRITSLHVIKQKLFKLTDSLDFYVYG